MTKQQIADLIAAKISGQGSAVDVGGALPAILNGILELIPEAYTLPVASDERLGGVKVKGNGLNVDSDGFIEIVPGAELDFDEAGNLVLTAESQADIYEDDDTSPNFIKGVFHVINIDVEISSSDANKILKSPYLIYGNTVYPRHTVLNDALMAIINDSISSIDDVYSVFGVYEVTGGSVDTADLLVHGEKDGKGYLWSINI